ncbi:hypothetical protein [Dactylosporangium sp. NPDC049140]|jgi:hypothetical protein|uniref:hypothetical protein n=1 Tax=Dactylosporangium sp. NPDC049140 TaxID=3155647 RepID=UPI0033DD8F4E
MSIDGFVRRLLIGVDASGYGGRVDADQDDLQHALPAVLDEAARRAGLDRSGWDRQPAGDGELAVLPEPESEVRVVDDFVRELNTALGRRNRFARPEHRLRLRLGIHHGVVKPAPMGFAGKGVVQVSRLVDAPVTRAALADGRADLAVIVSRVIFEDVVEQAHTGHDPARFARVAVENKELREDAWLYVPDRFAPPSGALTAATAPPASPPESSAPRGDTVITNITADSISMERPVFGFTNR